MPAPPSVWRGVEPMRRWFHYALLLILIATGGLRMAEASEALIAAATGGRLDEVLRLIAAGAPLEAQNGAGETALLKAVQGNHVVVAKALMAAGASINTQARNMDTPWLLAGAQGRTEIIVEMLGRKPDLSIRNRFGGNALIPACERAHVEAVPLLLRSGIDVNHVNNLGWTCLLEIVILGDGGPRHQQVPRLVLDAGAGPNIADKDSISPLAHARKRGQRAIAAMIEAKGGR